MDTLDKIKSDFMKLAAPHYTIDSHLSERDYGFAIGDIWKRLNKLAFGQRAYFFEALISPAEKDVDVFMARVFAYTWEEAQETITNLYGKVSLCKLKKIIQVIEEVK